MALLEVSTHVPRESAETVHAPAAGQQPAATTAPFIVAPDAPDEEDRSWVILIAPEEDLWRRYTPEDVLLALTSATFRVRCLVTLEIGGVGFDPYARGSLGEEGPAQLLSPLREEFFRRMGPGSDLHSPFQVVLFMEMLIAEGRGGNWSGWERCKWMSGR